MMEKVTGYLILVLVSSLFFIGLAALSEKFKKPVNDFLTKRIPLLMKVNRDTVIKGLAVAVFIIFTRKLIYYLPLDGVIQTKFSIWWVEGNAQMSIFISIVILFFIYPGYIAYQIAKNLDDKEKKKGEPTGCAGIVVLALIMVIIFFSISMVISGVPIGHLILSIFAPLLELKILCSGKYLGFLTGFLVGYLIVAGYIKFKTETGKRHINILIAPGLMLLIFLGFSVYQSFGNLQEQFRQRVQSAESPVEIGELLDALNTISNEDTKSNLLQQLAAAIASTGDSHWKQETFQQAIRTSGAIENINLRSKALKEIAVSIGETGDISWAVKVAMSIPAKKIRNNVLREIREKIEEK